jgi:hypothetical protein
MLPKHAVIVRTYKVTVPDGWPRSRWDTLSETERDELGQEFEAAGFTAGAHSDDPVMTILELTTTGGAAFPAIEKFVLDLVEQVDETVVRIEE